jgi:hypothetical protein
MREVPFALVSGSVILYRGPTHIKLQIKFLSDFVNTLQNRLRIFSLVHVI